MNTTTLLCVLNDEPADRAIAIAIEKGRYISELKSLFRGEMQWALIGIDAVDLAVYGVSVPAEDSAEMRHAFDCIDLVNDRLHPWDTIGETFPSPLPKHIHAILLTPNFQVRPVLRKPTAVPNTPPRRNSSSWSGVLGDNSHSVIDPLLRGELGNCAFRDVKGFHTLLGIAENEWVCAMEHRESCSCGLMQGASLPDWPAGNPKEVDVVRWFSVFNESIKSLDRSFYGSGKPSENMDDSRLGRAGTTGGRGCDIFLSTCGLQPRYSWCDVLVPGELKEGDNWDTQRKNVLLLSIAHPVREVFGAQPGRLFVHAFSISGTTMRCYLFDRGGVVASQGFKITKNETTWNLFSNILFAYSRMDAGPLGYDPGYETELGEVYLPVKHRREQRYVKVSSQKFRIIREISYGAAIVSRGTLCWLAEDGQQTRCVVKDAWRSSVRDSEGQFYKEAKDQGVWGLADCRHHDDIEIDGKNDIRSGIRRGLEIDPANMYKLAEGLDGPGSATASRSKQESSNRIQRKRKQPDGESSNTRRVRPTETAPAHWNRIHSRLVCFRIGRPIFEFRTITELLGAFADAIKGHRSLLDRCDILHCDISLSNIMIAESAQWKEGDPKGFLIDLDMASRPSSESNSGAFHRTGTFEFMAIEILERTERHSYRHDLESFFYVLLWLCVHYSAAGVPVAPKPTTLDGWSGSVTSAAASKSHTMGPSRFNRLLASLGDGFEVLEAMLKELRGNLFLTMTGEPFTGTPVGDHGLLYEGMIGAIDRQLSRLSAGGGA